LPKWMDGGMLPAAHLCTGRHPLHKAAPIRADDEERLDVLRSLSLLDTEPDPAFDRITHAASATLKVWMTPVHQPPCKLAFNPRVPWEHTNHKMLLLLCERCERYFKTCGYCALIAAAVLIAAAGYKILTVSCSRTVSNYVGFAC
jgi:hypothetical protein